MNNANLPKNIGLYNPEYEHDSCGVGFACSIKGVKSNEIVKNGLKILNSLAHRGATGADPKTGDGAGILIQMPHEFMLKAALAAGIKLPSFGEYGTGLIFLPQQADDRKLCKEILEKTAAEYGQRVLGWRSVPVDNSDIGVTARQTQPVIEQVFIAKNPAVTLQRDFEVKLYIIRKVSEKKIRESGAAQKAFFYVPSLSSNTFIYKGLLTPQQVENFFVDLKDESIQSAISLVHSRYSTNTFPTWDLAQPFRYLAHNGEINTLRGNVNWMRAKEALLSSEIFGADIEKIKPIVVSGGSDSAMLDNVFELLTLAGRSTAHAMLMLIPAAWEHNRLLDDSMRSYYQYQNCIMEAWDGPAAIAFTDGINVGAVLDRNGLRPARYIVTKNDLVVMASEVGVLDIDPALIAHSGRLEPGKIFYINTKEGRIVSDDEVKRTISSSRPYSKWVRENIVDLDSLPKVEPREKISGDLMTVLKSFGYTREDLKIIIKPMLETAQEPVGSMGNDAPPAVLSRKNQLLYNYFKQLFAQVTNPPIDSIREEIVMSLECYMGPRRNILSEVPEHCHRLRLKHPVLTNGDLEKIKKIDIPGFKTKVISTLFNPADESDFTAALDRISVEAEAAVKDGYTYIVLSDRGTGKDRAALPALLAVGAVHQHLVRKTVRAQVALIVESGEPREVHHFALLFGFGAGAVNPYLAFEACRYSISEGVAELDEKKAEENYIKAVNKGILKILAKMGISTLQSYRGAQIFEALGLGDDIINRCLSGTVSRIGGADFSVIAKETILRHREAYPEIEGPVMLDSGGVYSWRRDGEFHLWNPDSISAIQDAVRNNDYGRYREFAALINDQSKDPVSLRSLLKFKTTKPVPVEEVEPVGEIFKRFASGAMSFGSISKNAHETIAIAMNRIGGKSNTGEGGEDPARFKPLSNGDLKRSAIKQVASGRFGVNANYLINADEIQIKIAQGAKPGEGGQLPGHKVSKIIARTRYTTPGVTLISPPPHHDIYSIEDLAQLIFDLKNINPTARISVKLVSEIGVGTVAAGVAKGHADMILISGGDGGTGASPVSSIKHAGLPWELGLAETHQTLVLNDLRSRVRLQADGQIRTGRDIAIAAMLGAEEFGFATTLLIIMGCVMLRHCHMDTCSVGIATQNDLLEKRFSGRPEYIVNYFNFIAQDLREIMAGLGIRKIDDLVGRSDLLEQNSSILPWKAGKIDFSKILFRPDSAGKSGVRKMFEQNHNIDSVLDKKLIELSAPALKNRKNVRIELPVNNTNRSLGAMLSGEVCRVYGEEGLFDDAIWCRFSGIAGQSFGAFLANGVTFELEGLANDYVGKGISG
ncbi:MAG: glutamate synthase subunit alpha, partial [Elusimicrobia bacterium RIFOXYB1_FULL_48_9]